MGSTHFVSFCPCLVHIRHVSLVPKVPKNTDTKSIDDMTLAVTGTLGCAVPLVGIVTGVISELMGASTMISEGSLEVKLPTIWTDEKQRWEEAAKRREEERISKKKKSQKKEDPGARKGRKVAKHVFPMICGSGGSKSRLAKAAGAERAGQMRDEQLHAVVARRCAKHISKSKCTKHTRSGPLLEVEMSKKRTHHCGAKHICQ